VACEIGLVEICVIDYFFQATSQDKITGRGRRGVA